MFLRTRCVPNVSESVGLVTRMLHTDARTRWRGAIGTTGKTDRKKIPQCGNRQNFSRNKKLLGAPGLTTRSILATRNKILQKMAVDVNISEKVVTAI